MVGQSGREEGANSSGRDLGKVHVYLSTDVLYLLGMVYDTYSHHTG